MMIAEANALEKLDRKGYVKKTEREESQKLAKEIYRLARRTPLCCARRKHREKAKNGQQSCVVYSKFDLSH